MVNVHHNFRPYLKHVFVRSLIFYLVILLLFNISLYIIATRNAFNNTRNNLQQIAATVASRISAETHEKLTSPDQQDSAEYEEIESYFQNVMDGNPRIDDIYTLRPTKTSHQMTFVVSGMETEDINGNNYIEEDEQKPSIGERFNTTDFPDLEQGLVSPTADRSITFDKWGAWLSGYAPLIDQSGKTVAVVGVDLSADFVSEDRHDVLNIILIIDALSLPIVIALIYLLSRRLSRPWRILAQGMDKIAQGDFEHQLPMEGNWEEDIFIDLFNRMISMFNTFRKKDKN